MVDHLLKGKKYIAPGKSTSGKRYIKSAKRTFKMRQKNTSNITKKYNKI
jgi:hypothetical protein